MDRKIVLPFLVLVPFLPAPAMGQAQAPAGLVAGDTKARTLAAGIVSRIAAGNLARRIHAEYGTTGLDAACDRVVNSLEGRDPFPEIAKILGNDLDRIRFLFCARELVDQKKTASADLSGAQRVRTWLRTKVAGIDAHARQLKQAAQAGLTVAIQGNEAGKQAQGLPRPVAPRTRQPLRPSPTGRQAAHDAGLALCNGRNCRNRKAACPGNGRPSFSPVAQVARRPAPAAAAGALPDCEETPPVPERAGRGHAFPAGTASPLQTANRIEEHDMRRAGTLPRLRLGFPTADIPRTGP